MDNRFNEIEPRVYRFFELVIVGCIVIGYCLAWFACNVL